MGIFAFSGSKGGASRTASSILLAAGACELGFRPLHVQVLSRGRPPALNRVGEVPFERALITAERGESIAGQLWAHTRGRPECFPTILDMPAQSIRETMLMLAGIEARILLPMREEDPELERAAQDYGELRKGFNGRARPQEPEDWHASAWLLPVGWPSSLRTCDFAAILRGRGLPLDDRFPYPIIHPGIPRFDWMDRGFTGGDGRFELTDHQRDAAASVAHALWGAPGRP